MNTDWRSTNSVTGFRSERPIAGFWWWRSLLGWVCLLLLGTDIIAYGGPLEDAFESANRLYAQGKFAEAAASYQKITETGIAAPAVYYNCGNAFFKAGQIGKAIAYYRLTALFTPRDPDLRANLSFARQQAESNYAEPWWRARLNRLTLDGWGGLAVVCLWTWFGLMGLAGWFRAWAPSLKRFIWLAGLAALFTGTCLALCWRDLTSAPPAVVVVANAPLRYGPLPDSKSLGNLSQGAEVKVLDQKEGWLQILDLQHRTGWVQQDQVLVIDPILRRLVNAPNKL